MNLDEDQDEEEDEEAKVRTQIQRLRSESTEDYVSNLLNFALKPPKDPYAYMKR